MRPRSILFFILSVLVLLALLCVVMPENGIHIGSTTLRFPSLYQVAAGNDVDTVANAVADTVEVESAHIDYAALDGPIPISSSILCPGGDVHYFDSFFDDLKAAASEGRYVRILHYGDSQIEMDRMSGALRASLQGRYGGGGPGLVPVHPIIPSPAVSQSCSGNMRRLSSFGNGDVLRSNGNYGPMMQAFRLEGNATASFNIAKLRIVDDRVKHFKRVTLLFNNRDGEVAASLSVKKPSNVAVDEPLASFAPGAPSVGCLRWNLPSDASSLALSLSGAGDIYGVMLDAEPGVAVDNIPMRGCSGHQFTLTDFDLLEGAYSQMDVGLIIMQFGGNSMPYLQGEKSIVAYCNTIGKQIDYVHRACPKAKILFIGPSDMSTSVNGSLQSYPCLEQVVQELCRTALTHGAAFWSIYHTMGGHNSMIQWAAQGLAGSDYVHFSNKGAKIMGDSLVAAFDRVQSAR